MHTERRLQKLSLLLLLLLLLLQPQQQLKQQQQQQQQQQQYWSGLYLGYAFVLPAAPSAASACIHLLRCWGPPCLFIRSYPEYVGAPRLPPAVSGGPLRGPLINPSGGPLGAPRGPLKAVLCSPAQEKLALVGDGKARTGEYFVAEFGGAKRWMEVGRFYDVNQIKQKEGGKLMLLRVLLLQQKDGPTLMGQPFLENIRVSKAASTLIHMLRCRSLYIAS